VCALWQTDSSSSESSPQSFIWSHTQSRCMHFSLRHWNSVCSHILQSFSSSPSGHSIDILHLEQTQLQFIHLYNLHSGTLTYTFTIAKGILAFSSVNNSMQCCTLIFIWQPLVLSTITALHTVNKLCWQCEVLLLMFYTTEGGKGQSFLSHCQWLYFLIKLTSLT